MKKAITLLLIVAAAMIAAVSIPRHEQGVLFTTLSGATMGTTYSVRIAGDLSPAQKEQWQLRVQQCLDNVNARMSTYRADSEVSRFNRSASADWFPVSEETALVVAASLKVAHKTDGAFDITVGPLVNLWSFGPDRRPAGIPSDVEIGSALDHVGYQYLRARLEPPSLRKDIPELTIDLSGIAKGFAVDQVGTLLEQGGIDAYMVEVGGEVRTKGTKGDGSWWRIGVERPEAGQRLLQTVLKMEDDCLATSGDYRNFFQWNGKLYSHEIDPHTGRPAEHGMAAVSVLSTSTMWADAYATGLMVMPPEQAWRLAKAEKIDILMVQHAPNGFRQRMTTGFAARIAKEIK